MEASSANGDRQFSGSASTSPSLLIRVQAQHPQAWERLVDLYGPLVYHWCRRAQLNPADMADVFQEVFRSVAEHIGRFRRDRPGDTFRGWLRTITRSKILDHFRRLQHQPEAQGGTDAHIRMQAVPDVALDPDDSEADLLHQQVHSVLAAIRGEFEDRTWQAFWRVQMDGLSTTDAGLELGMTQAAVRKARLRVLRRLREEMGDLLE